MSATTQVKVLSPVIFHVAPGQGFHFLEANIGTRNYGILAIKHNVPNQPNPLSVAVTLNVVDRIPMTSRINHTGVSALPAAYGTAYFMRDIRIGAATGGRMVGNRYRVQLK